MTAELMNSSSSTARRVDLSPSVHCLIRLMLFSYSINYSRCTISSKLSYVFSKTCHHLSAFCFLLVSVVCYAVCLFDVVTAGVLQLKYYILKLFHCCELCSVRWIHSHTGLLSSVFFLCPVQFDLYLRTYIDLLLISRDIYHI